MITIFINNKPIYLTNSIIDSCKNSRFDIKKIDLFKELNELENGSLESLCLHADTAEELWVEFTKKFKKIDAAGGIVKNKNNEILCIFRNDKWDLPKGKVEKDEPYTIAAIREVEEETGVKKLSIIKELPKTYHIYQFKGEYVLKTTYWFLMSTLDDDRPVPQTEEGITHVEWISKIELPKITQNTYANIELFLKEFENQIFS